MPTIAIIGGGFSGTVTAVHLLRRRTGSGRRVILINRSGAMARGVAYGTQSEHHVLNVPAGRMSAFDDAPDHFVEFVRRLGVSIDGGAFVSRRLYGAYLEYLLNRAGDDGGGGVLDRVTAEVLDIRMSVDGTHAWLLLGDGSRIRADRVVLAVGNYPPAPPPIAEQSFFATSRRYVADPWAPGALAAVDPQAATLFIGTGLTMIDIALELHTRGLNTRCVAVSRRGLLPLPHRGTTQAPTLAEVPPSLTAGPATVRRCLRCLRDYVEEAATRGVDWRDVMASIRPVTPRVWQSWPVEERRRFMRHVRAFWDVHRHRVAPSMYDMFVQLHRAQRVSIVAGRLLNVREASDHVRVVLRHRGAHQPLAMHVGTVINCTGPAGDTRCLNDSLFQHLRARGLIRPDALGLGIDCSPTGAVIDAAGLASTTLFYVGPFLKARDWEATAVPELRRYASELANHLLDCLSSVAASPTHTQP